MIVVKDGGMRRSAPDIVGLTCGEAERLLALPPTATLPAPPEAGSEGATQRRRQPSVHGDLLMHSRVAATARQEIVRLEAEVVTVRQQIARLRLWLRRHGIKE